MVDYQPPAPSADHEWNATTKRWLLTVAAAALHSRQTARAQIATLEAGQHRVLREAILGLPGALERLREIDAQIAALRPRLAP